MDTGLKQRVSACEGSERYALSSFAECNIQSELRGGGVTSEAGRPSLPQRFHDLAYDSDALSPIVRSGHFRDAPPVLVQQLPVDGR